MDICSGLLRGQAKWPTGAPIRLPLELHSSVKRLFYEKTFVLNQAIAALRQYVGLPRRFVTVWKNRTRHTHTHNYCNPVAHVRQGLISNLQKAKQPTNANTVWQSDILPSACTHKIPQL